MGTVPQRFRQDFIKRAFLHDLQWRLERKLLIAKSYGGERERVAAS